MPELHLICRSCGHEYPVAEGCPLLLPRQAYSPEIKERIRTFWGELYQQAYGATDRAMNGEDFSESLCDLDRLFRHRRHLAAEEMPVDSLKGKRVLEIGSGAGAHSAYFSLKGAEVCSMDLTLDRVLATARKFELLSGNGRGFSVQGDAEQLPFPEDSFDIVYSNGVIHHTPRTEQALKEIHRVLKPSGRAVIMLYARDSFYFWANIFFIKGVLFGNIWRSRHWLGKVTEWMAKGPQKVFNPETKVYSEREIQRMFQEFRDVRIRKNSFVWQQVPGVGKWISRLVGHTTGYNPAGRLLYGHPWRNESRWELALGSKIGFGLNISAVK